ncbi:DUF2017 family protein [Citricoccus sp. NR2]|uniref:DUF2017 family protein n=1 Tax=Citricoccus sp. NR2 TaxID=3004095 RepID=UPI0022DD03E0|nr:DUF2017 family protein [Citricoccus sp. NR2]WBL18614.1 DUF2017 family protein [Citricoccus sp. NR2]
MARGFTSTPRGYLATFESGEQRLLRQLFDDVITLLRRREDETRSDAETDQAGAEAEPDTEAGTGDAGDADIATDSDFWALVSGISAGTGENRRAAPSEAATLRLLPTGTPDAASEAEAQEFRALTEDAVLQAKLEDLQRAIAAVESRHLVLDLAAAESFGRALNAVRLVLATRLEIETDDDAARVHEISDVANADSVDAYMALLYNFTSWLQETLMTALLADLPDQLGAADDDHGEKEDRP